MPMTSAVSAALFEASQVHPEVCTTELIADALETRGIYVSRYRIEDGELIAALREYAREGER